VDDAYRDFDSGGDGADGFSALAAGQDRGAFVVVDHGSAAADAAAATGGVQAVGGVGPEYARNLPRASVAAGQGAVGGWSWPVARVPMSRS
jgi:hypothetical protein